MSFNLLVYFLFIQGVVFGFEPPPLTGPVVDQANIIDAADEAYLSQGIRALNDQGRAQLQILTVDSLAGEAIEQASIDTVEKYQLGTREKDNGLLILVSKMDKKVRIEVGQGLEGQIPDLLAHRIIEYKITPQFREGQFGRGLIAAVGSIEALLDPATGASENQTLSANRGKKKDQILFWFIVGFMIFSYVFGALFGKRGARGGRGWYAGLPGGFGGGGFGGSGGGGWSGGGGGFSGGGASGGW